jgi:SAM-dependent methyltransferase
LFEEEAINAVMSGFTPASFAIDRLRNHEAVRRLKRLVRGQPEPGQAARIDFLSRTAPVSGCYGTDRGSPIDRYYIERFVEGRRAGISGAVLEVQDPNYTDRFGADVTERIVIGIAPGPAITLISDLQDLKEIASETVDCVILTQTLQFIYDLQAALASVHRVLKPGGRLIVTLPGICPLGPDVWPIYWSFTPWSAQKLVEDAFPGGDVSVETYGNVLSAMAFLHGLALEEMDAEKLDVQDRRYPVTIGVHAVKAKGGA